MEFPITLDGDFLKKSYRIRLFPHEPYTSILMFLLAAFSIVDLWRNAGGWLPSLGLFAAVFYAGIALFAWQKQKAVLKHWTAAQGSTPIIYRLSEEAVECVSKVGSTRLAWNALRGLEIHPLHTLILFNPQGAVTLPTDQVPPEALVYLTEKMKAAGKKVRDQRR